MGLVLKWLKNKVNIAQKCPRDLFNIPEGEPDQYHVLLKFGYNKDEYCYQIAFNTATQWSNNNYCINLINKDNMIFDAWIYPSRTKIPPVWNREFGDIDYLDFLILQKQINHTMKKHGLTEFPYNDSVEKTSCYFAKFKTETKYTQLEMFNMAMMGEPYEIVAAKTEAVDGYAEYSKNIAKHYEIMINNTL